MAGKRGKAIQEADLQGLKYFREIVPLLKRLHHVGCERDKAGNRDLHFDQYCLLILLAMFNPLMSSLRALQRASALPKLQKRLGVKRVSLGSLSEAVQVFDPEPLRQIVAEFGQSVPNLPHDPRLAELKQVLTLVDGTLLTALPQIAKAFWAGQSTGHRDFAWRLHAHFEVLRGVPTQVTLTEPRNGGQASERNILKQQLQADRCYVMDRGYQSMKLFNQIAAAGSSYVCRVQERMNLKVIQEQSLSQAARDQQILRDAVVWPGGKAKPDHPLRVITLKITPHVKRSGHKGDAGPASNGRLLIATNLLDVPAEIIALLFAYRWQIEIFFRFFKCVLGCSHLLSHHENGIEIQTYCAILACLLLNLWTGRKPTKATYEMICWYLLGWAEEADLEQHLKTLQPQTR